jgi:hypothetical protein
MDYVNIVHFKTIREYYNIESFGWCKIPQS